MAARRRGNVARRSGDAAVGERYKWVALSNTTLGVLIATMDASIVIISLPAIFRGIGLDPLAPGNIGYLLWMILGYLLVSAVLVVVLGRLGDMFGRVRMYNMGFAIFACASLALSLDPLKGGPGALWLIGFRIVQAVGGSMLTANSAAILTDAFPAEQRGMALGVNQITALAGQFLGLLAGGLLATIDWRAVFWISVPIGVFGTIWSYRSLRETGSRKPGRIDWAGNLTFTAGAGILLAAITYGIQPYGGHPTGWTNPWVLGGLGGGVLLLVAFCLVETRVAEPMFQLGLFRIRAFAAGNLAALLTAIARGGLQFMLIIWLQGIWLPLRGYDFEQTPLWAGIFMLPLTVGFLIAGPMSGILSDRYGARLFSTTGLALVAAAFVGLLILPVNFSYLYFAALLLLSGIGQGMFSAPNTSAIMGSVPPEQRGVASGMRATFQNSGTALSIGLSFSLMISGLAGTLPHTLSSGLQGQGVPAGTAEKVAGLPPVSTLFATFLGKNPISQLLGPSGVLDRLPESAARTLTGTRFFPELVSGPFHHGLVTVFSAAAAMAVVAALASALRGRRPTSPVGPTNSSDPTGASSRPDVSSPGDSNDQEENMTKSALLVMDVQQGIVERFGEDPAYLSRLREVIDAARTGGLPVVYVVVGFRTGHPEITSRNKNFGALPGSESALHGGGFAEGDPAARIHPDVAPQPGDVVVTKKRVSAFAGSDLDMVLRAGGIDSLVLTGIATSGVVLSTLRQAADLDFVLTVLEDCCLDADPEVHRVLTGKVFPRQADVLTADAWVRAAGK
ncbi:MFS transporter [Streptomyces sp. NBC_01014]|uniref:MFS transporter n=2 Tax=unclassified Streptomyces TaxID=2593676 RepID=UPI003868F754